MINIYNEFAETTHTHILQKIKNEIQKRIHGIFIMYNVLIPLAIGAYIYVYRDSDSYFGNYIRWLFDIQAFGIHSDIVKILRNWGCDFLFAYALLFALYGCTKVISISICYATACSIGLELLQLIRVDFLKCGTFDVVDIVVEIIAICFGATFISCFNHIKTKERRK